MSGGIRTGPGVLLGGDIAQGPDLALVSPYGGLPSLAIALVWGKQVELEDAADPDLERFIGALQQGAQTSEPKRACTAGVGGPS